MMLNSRVAAFAFTLSVCFLAACGGGQGVKETDTPAPCQTSRSHSLSGMALLGGTALATYPDASSGNAGTARRLVKSARTVSRVSLLIDGGPASPSDPPGETPIGPGAIVRASLEYPLGSPPRPLSFEGSRTGRLRPGQGPLIADPLALRIPAGATFAYELYERVPRPPAGASAAAAPAGKLKPGVYYVQLTASTADVESLPGAEQPVTTTAAASALAIRWQAHPEDELINVYVGSVPGQARWLGSVRASTGGVLVKTLNGQTKRRPPIGADTGLRLAYMSMDHAGEYFNRIGNGGDGNDYTGPANPPVALTGPHPAGGIIAMPLGSYGSTDTDPAIYVLGDSIAMGTGSGNGFGPYAQGLGGYHARALWGRGTESWAVHAVGGMRLSSVLNGSSAGASLLSKLRFARVVYSQFGNNDFGAGRSWQQLAADQVSLSRRLPPGVKLRLCTLTPSVAAPADFGMSISGQAPWPWELSAYNQWIRAGARIDALGTPVLAGGATPDTIDGARYFDAAMVVAADASNASSPLGSYWKVPEAPALSGTLSGPQSPLHLHLAGEPLATSDFGTWLSPGESTSVLSLASGASSSVQSNAAHELDLNPPLAYSPAEGEAWSLWHVYSADGVHPTVWGNAQLAQAFNQHLGAPASAASVP